MKNTLIFLAVLTLFGHYAIQTHFETKRLEQIIGLSDKALKIEADTIRDLMYSNRQTTERYEAEKNASYVSGVVATLTKPDHYNAIWHDGYDRGTEVQLMAQESEASQKEETPPQEEEPKVKTFLPVTLK